MSVIEHQLEQLIEGVPRHVPCGRSEDYFEEARACALAAVEADDLTTGLAALTDMAYTYTQARWYWKRRWSNEEQVQEIELIASLFAVLLKDVFSLTVEKYETRFRRAGSSINTCEISQDTRFDAEERAAITTKYQSLVEARHEFVISHGLSLASSFPY